MEHIELLNYIIYLIPLLGFIGSGSGTSADPYIVTDMDELNDVRNELTAFYEQANDIDAGAQTDNSGGAYWNGGAGWAPIGSAVSNFTGEYNGAGFSIDGLFIDRTGRSGLFAEISGGANITNVVMPNTNITSSGAEVGAITGAIDGDATISECSVGGTITGAGFVGGISGRNRNITSGNGFIARCKVSGTIETTLASTTDGAGGIVGKGDSFLEINDCYNTAEIRSPEAGGGISPYQGGDAAVNRCYSTGLITDTSGGTASYLGGLVGRNNFGGPTSDSFWDTQTSGTSTSDGGTGKTTSEMQDVATFTDTATTGLTNPWDFVGNPNDDAANNDYWDISTGYPFLTVFAGGGTNFDGAVSIGHTLGLSPSASAAVTGGVTNAQTMGMSDQGGATTLASLEQAISLALQTSGAISFEGNITIDVTYGQGSSATAQTSASLSGAENVTLFHAYTMSTSAQSSASGATSIDLTYDANAGGQASVNVDSEIDIGFDQSAEGVVGVTNFNAAVSLGDLTYQTSITGTASTVASTAQSIQYALDSIAAAAVSSNTSIAYINDISASATVITVDVTLADGRTLTIKMQNRTYSIDSENRTLTIDP